MAWRPDTSLIDSKIVSRNLPEQFFAKVDTQVLLAWIAPHSQFAEPPDVRFKLPSTLQLDATITWLTKDKKHWIAALAAPKGQPSQQDVAIGIATGPWQSLSTLGFKWTKSGAQITKTSGVRMDATVVTDPQSSAALPMTTVSIRLPDTVLSSSIQLVTAFSKEPPTRQPLPLASFDALHAIRLTINGDVKNLREIRLDGRTLEWHTIRAAHFRPK